MKPMRPMSPMKPLAGGGRWWPEQLGEPASAGAQNGLRYAFFPEKDRLLVEQDGAVTAYDSGQHRITGVQSHGGKLAFTGDDGPVALESLNKAP